MIDSICLVTAFFNIKREQFKSIPRTDDTYLENFKLWSRMRNQIVVYTDSYTAKKVSEIRASYGLSDKTKVVVIDDIGAIEPTILRKMQSIKARGWFERFRVLPNATSNIPEYSYLMLLKTWFLADASENKYVNGTVAWIDFGFNHGGDLYVKPEEFDFDWRYDFSEKIHLFYYECLEEKPIFEMVRRLCDSIMGCLYVLPAKYCGTLWQLTKHAMEELIDVGLYDDDQLLLLMSYRAEPDIFEMHKSEWFLPLKEYGGAHLTIGRVGKRKWYKQVIVDLFNKCRRIKLAIRNAYITLADIAFKD